MNAQSFGLLHSRTVDGRVDAEPLYVSQLTIPNRGVRNVLFVATENNTLYRMDADTGALLGSRHFGAAVPYQYKNYDDNVFPVMGILGTPVIDRSAGVIYLVADTYNGKVDVFRLHAISISTLKDVVPAAVIKISARLADGTTWKFNPKYHLQRPGLLEANGSIYVAFGSNGDTQPDQSRGNIARYDATTLVFLGSDVTDTLSSNTSSYYLSAIWQSEYGVAADSRGDIYFSTGNSDPGTPTYSASFNRPDSVVHLSGDLISLVDSFTPSDYFQLDQVDADFGSGGAMLLPDQTGSTPHLVVAGGKDGRAFLLNRDNLGGYTQGGPDNVLQSVNQGGCWCGPAYFVGSDGKPYVLTGGGNGITSWQLSLPAVQLVQKSSAGSGATDGLPDYGGSIPVVSSNDGGVGDRMVRAEAVVIVGHGSGHSDNVVGIRCVEFAETASVDSGGDVDARGEQQCGHCSDGSEWQGVCGEQQASADFRVVAPWRAGATPRFSAGARTFPGGCNRMPCERACTQRGGRGGSKRGQFRASVHRKGLSSGGQPIAVGAAQWAKHFRGHQRSVCEASEGGTESGQGDSCTGPD